MKLLHTSDWHLGKKLDYFSRLEEQKIVLEEIQTIADKHDVDAIIVAGDIYDTFNPPTEAISLFYKATKQMAKNGTRPVIAIAGNHDSAERFESPDPLAKECGIFLSGKPDFIASITQLDSGVEVTKTDYGFIELKLPQHDTPLRIITTAYANEQRLKTAFDADNSEEELRDYLQTYWHKLADTYCDKNGVNILLSHLFVVKKGAEMPEEPEDEKPILHVGGVQAIYSCNMPKQLDYVALGHLHRKQLIDNAPCPIYYSGSPLAFSFSEANQKKYVMLIDIEPGQEANVEEIELKSGKPLLRKKCNGIDEAVQWLLENPNVLVELTIVSNEYLTGSDKRRLLDAHEGIIAIIPEITVDTENDIHDSDNIDISGNMTTLFENYFKSQKGQEPNQEILDLFKEIISEEI